MSSSSKNHYNGVLKAFLTSPPIERMDFILISLGQGEGFIKVEK